MEDGLSLEDLMAELDSVQAEETKHRLSERNCVEILQTLMSRGLLRGLMYTQDGKEYLTPKQLELEILAELRSAGGRVTLVDLQTMINVDITYVEACAKRIARENKTIQLLGAGSEMVSDSYVESLINEISEMLLEGEGHITVGELATQYGLTVKFMKQSLQNALGKSSNNLGIHLKQDALYTDGFVRRHDLRVRGALNAVTRPTTVQKLVQLHKFVDATMVKDMVKKLIGAKALHGTLKNNNYTPDSFGRMQRESCETFFAANGYLPKDRAKQVKIMDAATFLRAQHPNVVNLDSIVLGDSILDRLEAVVAEVVGGDNDVGYLSVTETLEDVPLGDADGEMLAKKIAENFEYATSVGSGYVFSETFLGKCREMIQGAARDAGVEALQRQREQMMAGSVVGGGGDNGKKKSEPEEAGHGNGGKGKRRKKGKRDVVDDDEEPEMGGRGKKKKGKRGKRGKRGAADSDEEEDFETGSSSRSKGRGKKAGEVKPPRITTGTVVKVLAAHEDAIDEDALGPLASYFREFTQGAFETAHNEAMSKINQSNASSTRDILNALEKLLGTHIKDLEDFSKTTETFCGMFDADVLEGDSDDDDDGEGEGEGGDADGEAKGWKKNVSLAVKNVNKTFVNGCCKKILSIVVGMVVTKAGVDVLGMHPGEDVGGMSPDKRAQVISDNLTNLAAARKTVDSAHLASDVKGLLGELFDGAKKGPGALLSILSGMENDLDLLLKKTDKKAQKQYLSGLRKSYLKELSISKSVGEALSHMSRAIFLANGMIFPSSMDLFPLLVLPLPGKLLPVHIHAWLQNTFVNVGNGEGSVDEDAMAIFTQLAATKKLASLDEGLFPLEEKSSSE